MKFRFQKLLNMFHLIKCASVNESDGFDCMEILMNGPLTELLVMTTFSCNYKFLINQGAVSAKQFVVLIKVTK